MPGRLKLVRTSATKPGTTMVFTLVAGSRKPWTTSVAVRRNFTGVSTGTCVQSGTKAYCSATILTVTEPSGSTAVPRLLSANSPPRCNVVGSTVSTLLGGFSAWVTPVTTMIAIMAASMMSMVTSQRLSVRAICSSEISPSGSGRVSGLSMVSANGASRHEQEEVEEQPADKEQAHRDAGEEERAARALFQRGRNSVRVDRHRDIFLRDGRRRMRRKRIA